MIRHVCFAVAMALMFAASAPCWTQNLEVTPLPKLPRVTSKLPKPSEVRKDEIKAEDVGPCHGVYWENRRKAEELEGKQAQLEGESAGLEKRVEELKRQRQALDAEKLALEGLVDQLNVSGTALDKMRADIETGKARRPLTERDVERVNALVGDFNAKLAKRNQAVTAFRQREATFSETAKAFNASGQELTRQATQFGDRVSAFNAAAEALRTQIKAFDDTCVGEKRITR